MTTNQSRFRATLDRVSLVVNAPFKAHRNTFLDISDDDLVCGNSPIVGPRENILRRCDTRFLLMTTRDLEDEFPEKEISGRLIFDHPTIESTARHLCDQEDRCQGGNTAIRAPPVDVNGWVRLGKETTHPFTQLVISPDDGPLAFMAPNNVKEATGELYESAGPTRYFRSTDGIECVLLPAAWVWIGAGMSDAEALPFEKPCHPVQLSRFLIDVEPVSVGAFARFLNVTNPPFEALHDWGLFLLDGDERDCHLPLHCNHDCIWEAKPGVPLSWPMIMVSWYGANAYSLWANGRDWRTYRSAANSFLPTEAQWEYAARGACPTIFPWGDAPAAPGMLNVCWNMEAHDPNSHTSTPLDKFPLVPVNVEMGMSPFGLRHMAGNVMNWCRDTYDANFYNSNGACLPDAWNCANEGLKVERGGNWVEPAEVARSSWRRGRGADCKGRCLGFRCIGIAAEACGAEIEDDSTTAASLSDE